MSNEMAPECLSHKDNRNLQTRLDYMLLYHSEGKAKIIRVLETWTNTKYAEFFKGTADSKEQKSEPPVEDLWVTMSYDQFSLFVYGTIKHDTIKQQVDELVALKHIQRRPHPEYPYGPPQYLLNRELIQKSLNELEIPANLFDLVPTFVSPRKKPTPQERYPQGGGKKPTRDPGKIPPPTGETSYPSNNLSKNTKKHTENESTYGAGESEDAATSDASASAPAQSSQEYHPDLSYASQNESDNHSHIANDTPGGTNGHAHADTHTVADLVCSDLSPENKSNNRRGDRTPQQTTQTAVASQSAASVGYEKAEQATLLGDAPKTSARKSRVPAGEKRAPEVLALPAPDAEWDTTTCLRLFDFWRGAPLLAKHQLMDASHCAKGLTANYTRKQVEMARRWMIERDPYWSQKPSIVDVCTVAKHIHEILADIELARKAKKPATSPTGSQQQIELLRAEAQRYAQIGGTHA